MTDATRDRLGLQLALHEGLRLKPYKDTVGKLTIGYGRNLDDVGISRGEAVILLDADMARAESDVLRLFPWVATLDEARQAVLVNMAFNMGIRGLSSFVLTLDAVKHGRYTEAADRMLESKWATQVGHRAVELSEQMRTGEWGA